MKKILQTCFLALLCLAGSPPSAQSKVAESPGADLLHRFAGPTVSPHSGDSNRGGETLSDTFLQGFSLVDNFTSQGQEEGNTPARAGEVSSTDSLTIGDHLPSGIEFQTVLNNKEKPIHLDDYRGNYLILQFWAPTCSASISSLPKTEQLNEQFGDRLEILPVTVFSEAQIRETLEAFPTLRDLDLPLAVNAREVYRHFPHSVIPHFVVLSPEGEVLAITGLEDMTEKNLNLLINENQVAFRTKSDTQTRLDPASKLISENPQISNKNIWFQSAFTGYIPEVTGSLTQNQGEFFHIRIVNMTLLYHYRLAYSERSLTDYFGKNRIETIGFDPNELEPEGKGLDYKDWKAEGGHVFGYELIAPNHLNPYELMREDLKRFLPHIQATVETKPRTVLALVQQEGKSFPKSAVTQKSYKTGPQGLSMRMYPLDGFVYHLNAGFLRTNPIPITNRTGIDYPIDLDLDARLTDVESLRAALRQNGLDLIERVEEIPVLVLRKTGNSKLIGL
jgi:thiol-disulfide isomerase/thioredoxin